MSASPSDPERREAGPGGGDEGTDPGHGYPYDSLYRSTAGEPAEPMRRKARHWEPSLRPPDGEHQGFGWLYREESQPGGPSGTADPAPPGPALPSSTPTRVGLPSRSPEPPSHPVGPSSANLRHRVSAGRVVLLVLVALALASVIAVVVIAVVTNRDPRLFGSEQPTAATSASSSAAVLSPVQPAQVSASCQAPDATDDAGAAVSYAPGHLSDGDPSTAWRCPGNGVGQSITFTFARPTSLAQVGLINGYAKVDPASGVHRYAEYRRATQVTWALPGGVAIQQTLTDGLETMQQRDIPAVTTSQVTLTIDSATTPGSNQSTRDAIVLSEVAFAAAP